MAGPHAEVCCTIGTAMFIIPTCLFLGGLEFNATKLLRMAEVTSNDPAIHVTLGAHQSMGLKV